MVATKNVRDQLILAIPITLFVCIAANVFVILLSYLIIQLLTGNFELKFTIDNVGQISAIVVGTATLFLATQYQGRRELEAAQREIYQRLELASIELFRFEANHIDLIRPLWVAGTKAPVKKSAEEMAYHNYVCQILNLHEMALRFRVEKIMPDEVFESWIAWFWSLSSAPGFSPIWEDLKEHYIKNLRETFDDGVRIANGPGDDDAKHTEFRRRLKDRLNIPTGGNSLLKI